VQNNGDKAKDGVVRGGTKEIKPNLSNFDSD